MVALFLLLQSGNEKIVSFSPLCESSGMIYTKHLTESLASSWFPNLPYSHLANGISVPPGSQAKHLGFVLGICFYPISDLSVNLTTSYQLCCCPRPSHHCIVSYLGCCRSFLLGSLFLFLLPLSHLSTWQTECITVRVSWCVSLISHLI